MAETVNFLKMSTEKLQIEFKSRAELLRALIQNETTKTYTEDRTLREMWYQAIKIPLMRYEPDKSRQPNWGRKASQALSAVLSDMVLSGELKYRDVGIKDKSRDHVDATGPFDDVIIFVEDNATFVKVKTVAEAYRCWAIEGQGFEATALIEKLIGMLELRHGSEWSYKRYLLIGLTDYDAYGFKILEDLERRMTTLGVSIRARRAGICPSDVPLEDLDSLKFSIPVNCPYDEAWVEEHGIDGAYGLELQAVDSLRRKELLIKVLEEECPERSLYEWLKQSSWKDLPYWSMDAVTIQLMGTIKSEIYDKVEQLQKDGRWSDDRGLLSSGTVQRRAKTTGVFSHSLSDHPERVVKHILSAYVDDLCWDGSELSIVWSEGEDPADQEDDQDE